MGAFITNVATYFWLFCAIALIIALLLQAGKSSKFTLLIWIIAGLMMDKLAVILAQMSDQNLARQLWYLTWVTMNLLALFIITISHSTYKWQLEPLAKYIALCIVAIVLLQASRYVDRFILRTDLLGTVYTFGVPAINIAVVVAVSIWLFSLFSHKVKGISAC